MIDKFLARFSLWIGVFLPVIGVVILISYYVTDYEPLVATGFIYLYPAAFLNFIAIVAVAVLIFRKKLNSQNEYLKSLKLISRFLLLVLAYPVAFACVVAGSALMSKCSVIIRNNMDQALAEIKLTDSLGRTIEMENIPPHSSGYTPYKAKSDTSVKLRIGSINKEVTAFGYVTPGSPMNAIVEVAENGEVTVREEAQLDND